MTEQSQAELSTCPRCGLTFDWDGFSSLALMQAERCDYCAENLRRQKIGKSVLSEPNDAHPAGRRK